MACGPNRRKPITFNTLLLIHTDARARTHTHKFHKVISRYRRESQKTKLVSSMIKQSVSISIVSTIVCNY